MFVAKYGKYPTISSLNETDSFMNDSSLFDVTDVTRPRDASHTVVMPEETILAVSSDSEMDDDIQYYQQGLDHVMIPVLIFLRKRRRNEI
jgi:hypothetical protein